MFGGWLKASGEDKHFLLRAASAAQQAAGLVRPGFEEEPDEPA